MDTEMQNINQGVHLQIKEEKFENDKTRLENLDYTNCFETMDSHVKMEIDVHDTKQQIKQELWDEGYPPANIVNQHQNVNTGLENINQHGKLTEEKFENDKSHFENVDYTHYFENVDSNLMDKSNEDDDKFVEIKPIKQEIKDIYDQTENTNNPKNGSKFKDTELIIETKIQNYDLAPGSSQPENNIIENSCVYFELKPGNAAVSNEDSDLKFENNGPYIYTGDGNISKGSNFNIGDNSTITGRLDLKIEFIGLNIDKSDLKPEKADLQFNRYVSDADVIGSMSMTNGSLEKELKTVSHLGKDFISHCIKFPYKCKLCNKVFQTMMNLKKHMIRRGIERTHECSTSKCKTGFKRMSKLKTHMHIHSAELSQKCIMCNKAFKTRSLLRQHMISHSTEKPYKCYICETGFKSVSHLRGHMLTHSSEHPQKCNMCKKVFKTKNKPKGHMTTHTSEKSYKCNMCEKGFKAMTYLKKHMLIHSTEHPHKCNMCEKAFKNKDNLKRHMTTHTSEKPYKCNICDKKFKTMTYLKKHMLIHSTEHPHKCNMCEKAFKTKDNLKRHVISHSTECPHKCNMCEKAFKTMAHLRSHMTCHNTDKPHKCTICETRFKRLSELKNHIHIHSTVHPHKCNICEKRFKRLPELKNHMHIHSTAPSQVQYYL